MSHSIELSIRKKEEARVGEWGRGRGGEWVNYQLPTTNYQFPITNSQLSTLNSQLFKCI
ncbi:MAG: hypothetical protein ACRC62_07735 [Microcoleus sp.]